MSNTQQPIQTLSFRFYDDPIGSLHTYQGTINEINALLDDFQDFSGKALEQSSYIKRAGIKIASAPSLAWFQISPLNAPSQDKIRLGGHGEWIAPSKLFAKHAQTYQHDVRDLDNRAVRFQRNRDHERVFVLLQDAVNVTCQETGISYSVRLPSVHGMHMTTLHPLSFFSNVSDHVRSFDKKGLHLDKQHERQELAGMLLTALRHHKLLRCQDMVSANLCLQRAKAETLTHMIRFFVFSKSTKDMPSLRLIPEALYDESYIPAGMTKEACFADRVEIMLINYMRVCRGEGEGDTRHTAIQRQERKQKGIVRVYGGNMSIERRQADASQKHAYILLEHLTNDFHGQHETFFEYLESQIDAFAFLGTEKRERISNEVRQTLGTTNRNALELARIFGVTKTETIELGIEAGPFSNTPERIEGKPLRFNLTSKLKGIQS